MTKTKNRVALTFAFTLALALSGMSSVAHSEASNANVLNKTAVPVDTLPRTAATHFNFVVVVVSDVDRAFAFYTDVLGMRERGRAIPDKKHFEIIVGFDDNPTMPGISIKYRNGPPNPRGNGSSAINLVVKDLAAIVARVVPMGGKIVLPLMRSDTPKMSNSFAIIEDPDGNMIELVEYHRLPKQE